MFAALSYVLPVLVPSWRFFKTIEPSPRVEWAVVSDTGPAPVIWRLFRPPPRRVMLRQMLWRLFWNPQRNEDLFIVSCAERIQQNPTAHSIDTIKGFIRQDVTQDANLPANTTLQFRLVFVHRNAAGLVRDVLYTSDPFDPRDQHTA